MSDMRNCSICQKSFDFDKEGLGCGEIFVCSDDCAKKSAKSRGNSHAIHDETGEIVDTNADGTEKRHKY